MLKFHYDICNTSDEIIFQEQCAALEANVPNIVKADTLIDVDVSIIQKHTKDMSEIIVFNSKYINSKYVESDIDLKAFSKNNLAFTRKEN